MDCIAHRGFAGDLAENTAGALAAAGNATGYVEFDVRRCGSGEVVVVHDETVDRVTDGTGRVGELTRNELAALDVLGSGEGVPTLSDVLDAVPPSTKLNVELKERDLASDVSNALSDRPNPVLVSSFDERALERMGRIADYPLANLVEEDVTTGIERALDLDCAALHPNWRCCDRKTVERAHDAGLVVNAWTVADDEGTRAARDAAVDGIITDYERFCSP